MNNCDDPHHCRCFKILSNDILSFKNQLEPLGFYQEFEEDHGQVFGRVLRVEDQLQLHIKVMKNGVIEGEMEPPPVYPGAHLNQEHCYSAHREIEEILQQHTNIQYSIISNIPITCINPIIKKPNNPTHAKTIAAAGLVTLGAVALIRYLSDDEGDDE